MPIESPEPKRAETTRRPIPYGRALVPAVLLAVLVVLLTPGPIHAANSLSGATATPNPGTTGSTFTFTVDFASSPAHEPNDVRVRVANIVVPLTFVAGSGDPANGTYRGSASGLTAGGWPVVFEADGPGSGPAPLTLPGLLIVTAPSPTPGPTPPPTPTPIVAPTPAPEATPTPRATPRSTPVPIPRPPGPGSTPTPIPKAAEIPTAQPRTDAPTPTSTASASEPASLAPSAAGSQAVESRVPRAVASGSTLPWSSPGAGEPKRSGTGRTPWLFVGGGMATMGGAILVGQAVAWWKRRHPRSTV